MPYPQLTTIVALAVTFSGWLAAPPALAEDAGAADIKALLREKQCDLCHDETQRRAGPPFRMIAAFYAKADREATAKKLTNKIIKGGGGTWGAMPMPANGLISHAEALFIVNWILDLKEE
jgi:cytochrome c